MARVVGLKLVDMEVVERISLWQFSRKYRETEGFPGSGLGNLGLELVCRLKTLFPRARLFHRDWRPAGNLRKEMAGHTHRFPHFSTCSLKKTFW